MLGHDAEEFLGFLGGLQVEVVLADDRLGVARLNRRFADGAEFRDEHGNERVAQHVVREPELLREFLPPLLEIARDDRKFF